MNRVAVGIEYDGSAYRGWQRQKHSPSVQQKVEEALSFVADEPVELTCAGRTDRGVHALEQVVHFDTRAERTERAWLLGANCRLPRDIRLRWAVPVSADFHARFSAVARSYRYLILNDRVPSAIFHDKCCWEHRPLDAERMRQAAAALIGEHDFSSFRAAGCQAKSPIRRIEWLRVEREGVFIRIDIKANAFLHHMVRNIAGSLMAIGSREQPVSWLNEVLQQRDRRLAAMTAPAGGLYFVRADYPEAYDLPQQQRLPRLF